MGTVFSHLYASGHPGRCVEFSSHLLRLDKQCIFMTQCWKLFNDGCFLLDQEMFFLTQKAGESTMLSK